MSLRIALIALACVFALCLRGHAGEVAITGPTAVPVAGFPCTLHLQGELPEGTTVGWTVTPRNEQVKQIKPGRDGVSAELTTLAGFWNICAAIHEPGQPIYFRFYEVNVPGTPYTPSPGPLPNPPKPVTPVPAPPVPVPTPDAVTNRFGLRSKAAETARSVTSDNRAAEIRSLADGLKALAEQIRLGDVSGGQTIVNAVGAILDRCTSAAWDASRESLSSFIAGLIGSGQLATNDDWRQAVREAEAGLRDVI